MAIEPQAVDAVVREWLRDHVTASRELPDDYPLIENGVLTSLQTVELVLLLDERFGIEVTDDEFVEENFGSIAAISRFVAGRTG